MNPIEICISFVVAILAIAYPILLEVVSRLDEKYLSTNIIELFENEPERKWFKYVIYITLLSILVDILDLPPLIKLKGFDLIIENSASLFVLLCSITLIVFFILFVNKVLKYYTPTKFIKYLIKKDQNSKNDDFRYFKGLADILLASIRHQNEVSSKAISEYFYIVFQKRHGSSQGDVEYPYLYYDTILKIIEELSCIKSQKMIFLRRDSIGCGWLIGNNRDLSFSERTYGWIWIYLRLAIKNDQDDMIIEYWSNAHDLYRHNLWGIRFSNSAVLEQENKDNSQKESKLKRLKEFNFALGGLLLYQKRYSCIGRIFKYTMDYPPKQELLPVDIDQVIDTYMLFRDPYDRNFPWISHQYSFPETEGLMADGLIKKWICQYTAVLFLRQYTIIKHLITDRPLEMPKVPTSQSKKRLWLDNLGYFKSLVEKVYSDTSLKQSIGLNFLDDNWCDTNEKPKPPVLADNIHKLVERSYEEAQIEQTVSDAKRTRYLESTKRILKETIDNYTIINNQQQIDADSNKWYINGTKTIIDKSSFADDQESEHLNFDTFLSEGVSEKFCKGVSETFFNTKSHTFTLKPEDLFPAISKLGNKTEGLIIVCFGGNLSYYAKEYNVKDLTESKFQGIDLITFPKFNYSIIGESCFLIHKSDLPSFVFKEIEEPIRTKFSLTEVDNKYRIYASVVDLNLDSSKELREEFAGSSETKDLRKSVLVNIFMQTEIRWKKNLNNIYLRIQSPYRLQGLTNKISELNEINWPSC